MACTSTIQLNAFSILCNSLVRLDTFVNRDDSIRICPHFAKFHTDHIDNSQL
jgi:hypothetical protein